MTYETLIHKMFKHIFQMLVLLGGADEPSKIVENVRKSFADEDDRSLILLKRECENAIYNARIEDDIETIKVAETILKTAKQILVQRSQKRLWRLG